MTKEKYYTPKLEELKIGTFYECFSFLEGKWLKDIIKEKPDQNLIDWLEDGFIRIEKND